MQPAASIPPYDPEKLKNLIGLRCMVPRIHNRERIWWVTIIKVDYVSPRGALVTVSGGRAFGYVRQVAVSDLRFKKHATDPLVIAVIKGRENLIAK